MLPGIPYEFYASMSGLMPRYSFTLTQHQLAFFQGATGLGDGLPYYAYQFEYYRQNSGLTPVEAYTDDQHAKAYFALLQTQLPAWGTEITNDFNNSLPLKNLATNPSFERAQPGATSIVRRNLALDPRGTSTTWMQNEAGNSSVTANVAAPPGMSATTAIRVVPTGTSTSTLLSTYNTITLKYGVPMTVSAEIHNASSSDQTFFVWAREFTGSTTNPYNAQGTPTLLQPGETRRLSVTIVPQSIGSFLRMNVRRLSGVDGGAWFATAFLVEERGALLPYFDGTTANTMGIAYSWEGTANASTSVGKASTVEVRRNLANVPRGTTAMTSYGGSAGTTISTVTGITDHPLGITTANRVAYGQPDSSPGVLFSSSLNAATYTISAWVKAETIGSGAQIGVAVQGLYAGPSVTLTPGVWTRVSGTVMPTGTGPAGIRLAVNGTTGGSYLVTGILVELSSELGTYFDGDRTPDPDLMPAWTGTVNGSPSVLLGVALYDVQISGSRRGFMSWQWSSSGTTSIRIAPFIPGNNDNFVSPMGDTGGGLRGGMQPGKTYTVMARARIGTPLTGALGTRRIVVFWMTPASSPSYVQTPSDTIPNVTGVHDVRMTFTLPADATQALIRLYSGAPSGGGDIWYDDFALIEGEYTGPYRDGNSPYWVWSGTTNGSPSAGYV